MCHSVPRALGTNFLSPFHDLLYSDPLKYNVIQNSPSFDIVERKITILWTSAKWNKVYEIYLFHLSLFLFFVPLVTSFTKTLFGIDSLPTFHSRLIYWYPQRFSTAVNYTILRSFPIFANKRSRKNAEDVFTRTK